MPALETPTAARGFFAPDFLLKATNGSEYRFRDIAGDKGTLIMFICNHCPFVKAVIDSAVRDAKELQALGIGVAAIMPNDAKNYPEDSFANMVKFAASHGFTFPYLIDETQGVARAYGAVCTPDFFGFNANHELQYRGRLDASRMEPAPASARRELFEAMRRIVETGQGPATQLPSMGCSIKWKEKAA
jgi:peroxiredoxin